MKVKKDDGKLPRETKLNKVETVNEGSLQKFFELDNFYFAYGCQNYNSSHTRKLLILSHLVLLPQIIIVCAPSHF